jgi:hypothetical protein
MENRKKVQIAHKQTYTYKQTGLDQESSPPPRSPMALYVLLLSQRLFGATTAMAAVCMEDKNACRLRLALAASGELGP